MVEMRMKVNTKLRRAYIPKAIVQDMLGETTELKIVSDKFAGVIFPQYASYDDVVKSLRIVLQDIEHRAENSRKL